MNTLLKKSIYLKSKKCSTILWRYWILILISKKDSMLRIITYFMPYILWNLCTWHFTRHCTQNSKSTVFQWVSAIQNWKPLLWFQMQFYPIPTLDKLMKYVWNEYLYRFLRLYWMFLPKEALFSDLRCERLRDQDSWGCDHGVDSKWGFESHTHSFNISKFLRKFYFYFKILIFLEYHKKTLGFESIYLH